MIIGTRLGENSIRGASNVTSKSPFAKPPVTKGNEETKVVNYTADVSGCGHYRMIWPSFVLNSAKNYMITDTKRVVLDDKWYGGIDTIRCQRQVSTEQYKLFTHLRKVADKHGVKLVYELDDIPLYEDIPLYNRNRNMYARDDYRQNIINMMNMSDEITVSTKFMRDYFLTKISNTKITYVPNYIPKFWMDRYYDEDAVRKNFVAHNKKPRILYAGSGSHYGSGAVEDDFTKLEQFVHKTLDIYQWVFFGGIPAKLIPLYKAGKIEFHNYSPVVSYPETFAKIKPNICLAPLVKNNFNRAKSNIKLTESGAYGIPCICQGNIDTYEGAPYTFDTPDELYDQITKLTKNTSSYVKASKASREISTNYWLEDNIDIWDEMYRLPYNDSGRINLNKIQ